MPHFFSFDTFRLHSNCIYYSSLNSFYCSIVQMASQASNTRKNPLPSQRDPPNLGNVVRFLGPRCHVTINPPNLDFEGNAPEEAPAWVPIEMPLTAVGSMRLDTDPWMSTVFLRPKCLQPYYTFCLHDYMEVLQKNIRLDPKYRDQVALMKLARELVERRLDRFTLQLQQMTENMREWRVHRRMWEYSMISHEYLRGNRDIFVPGFTLHDINAAYVYMKQQNKLDRAGRIPVWDVGQLTFTSTPEMTIPSHMGHSEIYGDTKRPCSEFVSIEMQMLTAAMLDLDFQIADADAFAARPAQVAFILVKLANEPVQG